MLITIFMFIQVNTEYPKKIDCSKKEMKKELKDAFGALGRLWLTEINATKFEKRQTDQLKTFQKFLTNLFWNTKAHCKWSHLKAEIKLLRKI